MTLKVYEYSKCSTCKKALKFLDSKKIPYQKIAIQDQPPSKAELQKMLSFLKAQGHNFKKLFNTSGGQYRELNISEKIAGGMSEDDALALLSKNGMLVKRPFVLGQNEGSVGFVESDWKKFL